MRGFKDNLPPLSYKFEYINNVFRKISNQFAVDLIELNFVDESSLYFRTSGQESEICQKELFEVRRFNGEYTGWVLRPEATATCVRAIKENNFLNEKKIARLGYFSTMFRYNRPQKGRYRQFIQAGWEWFGQKDKYVDYEILVGCCEILKNLNINYTLEINSIGSLEDRKNYKNILKEYLKINTDPFKVLDKLESYHNIPVMHLNSNDQETIDFILKKLSQEKINYIHNPYLVRGLDYYNGLVFEFKVNGQSILGGGRYDSLMQQLEGPYTPAIGFAMGVDRLVNILEYEHDNQEHALISINCNEYAMKVLSKLRHQNKKCIPYWNMDIVKALKLISKKSRYAVIVGENEEKTQTYIIKDLTTGIQSVFNF